MSDRLLRAPRDTTGVNARSFPAEYDWLTRFPDAAPAVLAEGGVVCGTGRGTLMHEDTPEIGFREDGVMWLTMSVHAPDARAAEAYFGGGWRVVEETYLDSPSAHTATS